MDATKTMGPRVDPLESESPKPSKPEWRWVVAVIAGLGECLIEVQGSSNSIMGLCGLGLSGRVAFRRLSLFLPTKQGVSLVKSMLYAIDAIPDLDPCVLDSSKIVFVGPASAKAIEQARNLWEEKVIVPMGASALDNVKSMYGKGR